MKKVLFLQTKGKSRYGVWNVNRTIAEGLINLGFDATVLSIRNNPGNIVIEHDERLKLYTINEKDLWEITRKKDIKSIRTFIKYIVDHIKIAIDYKKAEKYIHGYNPDYIIATHYQCLDFIPKKYLKRTVHIQHSSVEAAFNLKANYNTLKKNNNRIFGFAWLSKSAKEKAIKEGFNNNYCLYNPVRFSVDKINNKNNKKIICITRIENENKRIDLMIKIVSEVLKKNPQWSFELYGPGTIDDKSLEIMNNNSNMKYMGITKDPKNALLASSINLNTSVYEGFSLSILEAAMCGVPTLTFNFGESVYEEIEDNKTGYIIEGGDVDLYIEKLNELMNDPTKLRELGKNAHEFAKNFEVKNVISNWLTLFEEIDKKGE